VSEVIALVDFGNRLKALRKAKDISQEQLAKRMGITKSMISAYELSMRMPSYQVLLKIARFFNVTIDYLLGLSDDNFLNTSGLTDKQNSILSDLIDEFRSEKSKD